MDIYHEILKLFDNIPKNEKIRSIGIRLDGLNPKGDEQISIFEKKDDGLQKLMDDINSKYQNTILMPAVFYDNNKSNK